MDISDKQLKFFDSPLITEFDEAITYIRDVNFEKALEIMEKVLIENDRFPGVIEAIKSIKFWQNRWLKIMMAPKGKEQAEVFFSEWENYLKFIKSFENNENFEKIFIAFKNLIYKRIIENLIFEFEQSEILSLDLLKKLGKIFFEIEDYKNAIEIMEYAYGFNKRDSFIISILADSYYLTGEEDRALILYREAFFYEPEKIELNILKSEPIKFLKEIALSEGIKNEYLNEWIGVLGIVLNVFNQRNNLTPEDVNKIEIEIKDLESKLANGGIKFEILKPRLIYRYLLLIEYYFYQISNRDFARIYLTKLKGIDINIYNRYIKLLNLKE